MLSVVNPLKLLNLFDIFENWSYQISLTQSIYNSLKESNIFSLYLVAFHIYIYIYIPINESYMCYSGNDIVTLSALLNR